MCWLNFYFLNICRQLCQQNEDCIFYHYYEGASSPDLDEDGVERGAENVDNQPSQCFLYDECSREVLAATDDCPLTK